MKKIIAFTIGLFSVTVIFAQSHDRNDRFRNYNESGGIVLGRGYDSPNDRYGYNSPNVYNYPSQGNDNRYDEQRRREEMDRINSDYDRRVDEYRRDRSIDAYERDRRIQQTEYERREKLKSFAGGAVVGAVAGVLLGAVLNH